MTISVIQKQCLALPAFVTNPEPAGQSWQLDSTRQILRASGDDAYLYVPVSFAPGSIIKTAKIRWGAGGTGDGFYANLQRREAEGVNKYYSDVTTVETFTRSLPEPEQRLSEMSGYPITIEEGYNYVLHFTSQVVGTWAELYDLIIYTQVRLL